MKFTPGELFIRITNLIYYIIYDVILPKLLLLPSFLAEFVVITLAALYGAQSCDFTTLTLGVRDLNTLQCDLTQSDITTFIFKPHLEEYECEPRSQFIYTLYSELIFVGDNPRFFHYPIDTDNVYKVLRCPNTLEWQQKSPYLLLYEGVLPPQE